MPFYNDISKLSTFDWLIVLASVLLIIGYLTVIPILGDFLPVACFLTCTVPALYICKGDYSLFFKKLRLKDIGLIILCVIGIFVYAIILSLILTPDGMVAHVDIGESVTIMSVISLILQIMGEEFYKVFLLLLAMYVMYKLTKNRAISILIGLIVSMTIFGLSHYSAYDGRILQIILIQGFGSIFEYFAYLKTKNIWVSYLAHLIQDLIPTVMILLNVYPPS